jgi:hypothetical protein
MYISYEFIVDASGRTSTTIFREVQIDVESIPLLKATNARRHLQPALSLTTQSHTLTTMQLKLPRVSALRDGRLEIKSLRRSHVFLFIVQFQIENEKPSELILLEPITIVESIQYFPLRIPGAKTQFVFLQLKCLESGIAAPSWLEDKSFDLDKDFEPYTKKDTRLFSGSHVKGCLVKRKSTWFLFSCFQTDKHDESNEVAFSINENLDKYVYMHSLNSATAQITVMRDTLQVSVLVF